MAESDKNDPKLGLDPKDLDLDTLDVDELDSLSLNAAAGGDDNIGCNVNCSPTCTCPPTPTCPPPTAQCTMVESGC